VDVYSSETGFQASDGDDMRHAFARITSSVCGLALGACVCAPSFAAAQTSSLAELPALEAPQFPPALAPTAHAPAPGNESRGEDAPDGSAPPRLVPSFGQLFKQSAGDFAHLTKTGNWMVIAGGLGLAGLMSPADRSTSSRLSASDWAEDTFGAAALTGAFPLHVAAGFAAYGVGRISDSPRVAQVGADLVRAQLLSQATAQAVKFADGRTRPDGTPRSFPSGHSASMFASATVLHRHFGWKVGIPAYAAATYVAAGRIQTQRHYLSDVAFGAALGIMAGRTVTVGHGKVRFALAPAAMPGGMGVSATLLRHPAP
jgi:membrane-associated phospholipid phosphatase